MLQEEKEVLKQGQEAMPLEQGLLQEKQDPLQEDEDMKQKQEVSHEERTGLQGEPMVSPEKQKILHRVQGATGPSVDPQSGGRKFSNLHFDGLLGKENKAIEDCSDMDEEDSSEASFLSCLEDP